MSPSTLSAETLTTIAQHAQILVRAETSVVALSEADGAIFYAAAVGKHAAAIQGKRGARETSGLCGVALDSGQAELVCQTQGDLRVRQDLVKALEIATALATPIIRDGQVLGALMVLNRQDGSLYDEAAQAKLTDYAQEIAEVL